MPHHVDVEKKEKKTREHRVILGKFAAMLCGALRMHRVERSFFGERRPLVENILFTTSKIAEAQFNK